MTRKAAIISAVLLTLGMGAWLFTIAARELQVSDPDVADAITVEDPIVIVQTATAGPTAAVTPTATPEVVSTAGEAAGYAGEYDYDDDDDSYEYDDHDDDHGDEHEGEYEEDDD